MTGFNVRSISFSSLAICLAPLVLAGCGGVGGEAKLSDSARLTPTVVQAGEKAPPAVTGEINPVMAVKKPSGDVQSAGPQVVVKSKTVIMAKADGPPVPIRRPYRKVRSKKSGIDVAKKSKLLRKKTVQAARKKPVLAKPVAVKTVVKKALPIKSVVAKPVVTKPAVVKAQKVPMVPVDVIPAQIAPSGVPQDIMDAFNETSKLEKPAPEKLAKAETVPIKHNFGQSEHRFSGQ